MNTFDEIIQTKAYSDLSSSELEIIQELVSSEEEYNEMKSFYSEIDQLALSNREEVSASVKTSLNSVFQAKHPGISQSWNAPTETSEKKIIPLYNRNLFRAAALLVLSAGVTTVWFSMSDEPLTKNNEPTITASTDSVHHGEVPKVQEKKKFPLNEGNEKEFTAASTIPADKNVAQKTTIYSNAAPTATYTVSRTSSGDESTPMAVPAASGSTYSFAKVKKQDNWSEAEKGGDKKGDLLKAGLAADLNPGGFYNESVKDYKPSIKTSDYLTLIEPSF